MRKFLKALILGVLGFFGYKAIRSLFEVEKEYRRKINSDFAITGYLDDELLERIKENLEILLDREKPDMVYVGEVDNPELKAHRFRRFDSAYILYKTTSLDFAKQMVEEIEKILKEKGLEVFQAGFSHRKDAKHHHVYVGFVKSKEA